MAIAYNKALYNMVMYGNNFVGPQPEKPEPEKPLEKELVATPVVGWRMWAIAEPANTINLNRDQLNEMADMFDRGQNPFRGLLGTRLQALGVESRWDQRTTTAECRSYQSSSYSHYYAPSHDTPAPQQGCACGIWAFKTEERLERAMAKRFNIEKLAYGQVTLWGKAIEHTQGYRAQYARPASLKLIGCTEQEAVDLADFYKVPVELVERPERVLRLGAAYQRQLNEKRKRVEMELFFGRQELDELIKTSNDMAKKVLAEEKKARKWWAW